jgi:hypothetical protein
VAGDERVLRSVLGRVRRRWFAAEWSRAATRMAIGLAVLLGAVAWALRQPWIGETGAIAVAAAALLAGVAVLVGVAWPLRRRPTDRQVARYVEERCPELEDRLASAADWAAPATSSPLRSLVLRDAAARAADLNLDRIVERRVLARRGAALACAVALVAVAGTLAAPGAVRAWHLAMLRAFPSMLALEVEPGDVRLTEGERLPVSVRLRGLPRGVAPGAVVLQIRGADGERRFEMDGGDERFRFELEGLTDGITYSVTARGLSSREFEARVRRLPRVARIDVHYRYPAYTGLAERLDEDSGDVYAPKGTEITLAVHATETVEQGAMLKTNGAELPLTLVDGRRLEARFIVERDEAYRVALASGDGVSTRGDTEYFIRTVDDRPPDVRVVRPGGDRKVTRLEEVVIEARADDDYGVEALEIVYAVRGGQERVVPLHRGRPATAVSGNWTLFVEDLDVQPGDFISYFARARDVGRGKRSTVAQSDIFFLEVRPFNEEFEAAQSQAQGFGGGGNFDALAQAQKDIVVATWKLVRRSPAGQSAEDVAAVARAQAEVRARAEALAQRMRPFGRPRARAADTPPARAAGDAMTEAVGAMREAEAALNAARTNDAVPHEMEALNHLLRAQADVRRRQVSEQRASAAGGGGQTGNEDLSALFDRELQRQQQTNYESHSSAAQRAETSSDDALARLRELARRQDELGRQQRELARRRAELSQEEVKRQLERLTREQQELRQQAEALAREMANERERSGQQGGQAGEGGTAGEVGRAAAEMKQAAEELARQRPEEAGGRGARALDRLRAAERGIQGGRTDERRRAAGDMQLEARQLAEAQRRVGDEAQAAGQGTGAADTLRRLAGEQDRLAERVERLQQDAQGLSAEGRGADADALRQAARELSRAQTAERMRGNASRLRESGRAAAGPGEEEGRRAAREAGAVAEQLERAADALSSAAGQDGEGRRLSEQLARARPTRERLAALEARIDRLARELDAAAREGDDQAAGTAGRRAEAPGGEGTGEPRGRQGELAQELARLQQEYAREAGNAAGMIDALGQQPPGAARELGTPEGYQPSRSAPGTEAFKQDFARWDVLRRDLGSALEQTEAAIAGRLNEQALRERLEAGGDDRAPDHYRDQIAKYFRAIAGVK